MLFQVPFSILSWLEVTLIAGRLKDNPVQILKSITVNEDKLNHCFFRQNA